MTDELIHEIAASYMEADTDMYVSFLPSNLDKFARALLSASKPAVPWIAHWAGSNPYKGWSIRCGREEIIWFGETISSETVEGIVLAHNKCFDCDGTGCVMNCGGLLRAAPAHSGEVVADVPEGCTVADARVLRAANHALTAENELLRKRLRPFAHLVGIGELSWAMVEYCVKDDPEKQTFQAPQMQRALNRAAEAYRNAAPQPSQPAKAADDERAGLGWITKDGATFTLEAAAEAGKTYQARAYAATSKALAGIHEICLRYGCGDEVMHDWLERTLSAASAVVQDDERAAFEAWAKTENMDLTPFGTTFDSDFTSKAWDAWQARAALAQPVAQTAESEAFQSRVQPWMLECFGQEIAADKIERNHRFYEEATETVQANGMTRSEAHQLVDYTYDRPVGELHQEIGGVMVTLAALCLASGQDMHVAGETELARIWTKVEAIRAKQAAKPKHSPLPAAHPAKTVRTLTDERIVESGYMHTVETDEPLFTFDRKELIAMVRELLTAAQPASGDNQQAQES